jgi:hypothetical protein
MSQLCPTGCNNLFYLIDFPFNQKYYLYSNWGGEGSLGCGIGYGYLHRIPSRSESELNRSTSDGQQQQNIQQMPYQDLQSTQSPQQQPQQHQYQERKPYELQPQPPQLPPQQYQPQDYQRAVPTTSPVVVYDHKHQQEVFNANVEASIPSSISSMSSSLAGLNLGEGGDQYQQKMPTVLTSSTTTTSSATYPMPATLPVSQIGSQPFMSDANKLSTDPYGSSYAYTTTNYSPVINSGVNSLPTYASQQSFTTPISLPGMPPLTVSATLPTDKFPLPLPNNYQSHRFNPPNIPSNQSVNYQLDPINQSYSPQI